MSGTPTISIDTTGNSYVSIGVTDVSNQRVNLTTVKRASDGTQVWTQTNTISTASTGDSTVINNLYHYLHDNPDKPTSLSNTQGPININISFTVPEAVSFAGFRTPLPSADYLKLSAGAITRSVTLVGGVNDVSGGISLRSDVGTDGISNGVAIFYLGGTNLTTGTFTIDFWFEGEGGTSLSKNKATLSGISFAEYGAPSAPRSLTNPSAGAKNLTLSWTVPEFTDISNNKRINEAGAPTISSYKIYPSVVSSSRFGTTNYSGGTKTASTTTYNLTGLYPATTYGIEVSAVNNGAKESVTVAGQFTTGAPTVIPKNVNASGITLISSDFSGPLYAIGNPTALTVPVLRVTGGGWTTTLVTPIGVHHSQNIGSTSQNIMTFSSEIDSESYTLSFDGFNSSSATKSGNSNVWSLSGTPTDISTGVDSGYFLQVAPTLSFTTADGVSANKTLILRQILDNGGGTHEVSIPIQWDKCNVGVSPSLAAGNITVTPDSNLLKQICGAKYFGSEYGFTVGGSSISNMGSHHHLANPVIVTIADASTAVTTLDSTSSFSGVSVTKSGNKTYFAPGDYSATVSLRNLNNNTSTTTFGGTLPVIDPSGVTLWTSTTPTSIPDLSENLTYGRRVTSIGLNVDPPTFSIFPDTTIDLTSGTGQREAILAKGYFCCPGFAGAYINYPGAGSKNYAGITSGSGGITSDYRYATFQWNGQTMPNKTRTYSYLKIQIETAGNTTLGSYGVAATNTSGTNSSRKLYRGTDIIDIYYGIQYSGGSISWSGWIDANSVSNNGNFSLIVQGNPIFTGAVGGQAIGTINGISLEPSESGTNTYTFYVTLPTVSATQESSVFVAVGGKSATNNGLGFKVQASYVLF